MSEPADLDKRERATHTQDYGLEDSTGEVSAQLSWVYQLISDEREERRGIEARAFGLLTAYAVVGGAAALASREAGSMCFKAALLLLVVVLGVLALLPVLVVFAPTPRPDGRSAPKDLDEQLGRAKERAANLEDANSKNVRFVKGTTVLFVVVAATSLVVVLAASIGG